MIFHDIFFHILQGFLFLIIKDCKQHTTRVRESRPKMNFFFQYPKKGLIRLVHWCWAQLEYCKVKYFIEMLNLKILKFWVFGKIHNLSLNLNWPVHSVVVIYIKNLITKDIVLFKISGFVHDEKPQRNASEFVIFLEYENLNTSLYIFWVSWGCSSGCWSRFSYSQNVKIFETFHMVISNRVLEDWI